MHNLKATLTGVAALLIAMPVLGAASKDDAKTLNESTTVLAEMRNAPDIPDTVWSKAECVLVIPSLKKAGFIFAGEFGEGVMSCRRANTWGAPVFMKLTKGSAGLQAGVQSTDLVLLVMNRRGVEKLLSNKVTLGADASVAAGPVGRHASASTDAQMTAEMLSYSRSKGLFAGIDLSGGSLRPDDSANARMYGTTTARAIALSTVRVVMTTEARAFTNTLDSGIRATSGVKK